MQKITSENVSKFIEEARIDKKQKAKDTKDYEAMLLDFINEEFKGL